MSVHPWNRTLWSALTADREKLPHALLLHGPRGIGKKEFAHSLGQWLLCEQPGVAGGCGECAACVWMEQGGHPDFRQIEPAAESGQEEDTGKKGGKQIAINEIRALGESLALASHQGGWRVVIIHPAETMNPAAANALLKTLEEPPERVMLILIAHQPGRLLPTILSRCRKVGLAVPPRAQSQEWLTGLGRGDALTILDEVGGAPLLALEWASEERMERRRNFLRSLAKPSAAVLSALAQDQQSRTEEAWGWLTRWLYDLQATRASGQARYYPEAQQVLRRLAERIEPTGLWELQLDLVRAGRWLRHPLNGQLLLESWLLRYLEALEAEHGG